MIETHGQEVYTTKWIHYFYKLADFSSTQSTCLSRQVGAVLVRDKVVVATGFNGPPRGYPHCTICPRRLATDYTPGTRLECCPAVHAEINCIAAAARSGTCVKGTTLFLNTEAPCKNCMATLINAGVEQVFALNGWYDVLSQSMADLIRVHIYQYTEIFQ